MLTLRFFLCLLTITLLGGCGSSDGRDTPNRTTTDFIVSVTLPESTAAAMLPAETALHTRSTNAGQRTGDNKVAREADTNQLTIADFAIDRLLADNSEAARYRRESLRITGLVNLGDGHYRLITQGTHTYNTLITVNLDNVQFQVLALSTGTTNAPLTLELRSSAAVAVLLDNISAGVIDLNTLTATQANMILTRVRAFIESIGLPEGLGVSEWLDYLSTQAGHLCSLDDVNAENTVCVTGHTLGGTLSNLQGTLILLVNGAHATPITNNGEFTLLALLATSEAYEVTVANQPAGQSCAVTDGEGTMADEDRSSITVNCSNTPDSVTVNVSGIENEGISVRLSSSEIEETLAINADGSHPFNHSIVIGNDYTIEISSQPTEKYCYFTPNNQPWLSSTAAFATPISLNMVCETPQYQVSGAVGGLIGDGIRIQFNGIEIIDRDSTGGFSFSELLHRNENYEIGIVEQPAEAYCTIDNGYGYIDGSNISNVAINCVAMTHHLSGTINNLNGTLLLDGYSSGTHNTQERLVLNSADNSFEFTSLYPQDDSYHLDIPRQPAGQLCTIDYGKDGNFSNGNVSDVVINCVTDDTPPDVVSISPSVVLTGEEVQIFGQYIAGASVTLDGTPITPILQGAEQISFIAPDMEPGEHTLAIATAAGTHTSTLNYGTEQTGVVAVDGGAGYTCLLIDDGTVKCFGYNANGRLGQGEFDLPEAHTSTPHTVTGLSNATAISTGSTHACALTASGAVYCWGANNNGELGNQDTEDSALPVRVTGLTASVISAGAGYSCAVEQGTGDVYCWGYNGWGQLGDGTNETRLEPTKVNGLTGVVMVSADELHTCALVGSPGTVYCWGANNDGRLGNGTTTSSYSPVAVSGITNAISVTAGYLHSCALLQTGEVRCWGSNHYSQLGDATFTDDFSSVPISVGNTAVEGVSRLVSKAMHTCYITSDQHAECWGTNHDATLGDNTALISAAPVRVHALSNVAAVGLGYSHSCAVLVNGHARCWGLDGSSEQGTGGAINRMAFEFGQPVASAFNSVGDVSHLSVHAYHACAVVDGRVYCMGENGRGELGNGSHLSSTTPVQVIGITNAIRVYNGLHHSCALRIDGTVACWGANDQGQLGSGDDIAESTTPVTVASLSDVVSLSVGYRHNCAARSDGTAYCWGDNQDGGLGIGTMAGTRDTPVQVQGIINVSEIGASKSNNASCARVASGNVYCWGSNQNGELGNDSFLNSAIPIAVQNLSGVTTLVIGGADISDDWDEFQTMPAFMCAIRNNGELYCWGAGHEGQFGIGPGNGQHNVPARIPLMQGVISASIGGNHVCAVLADHTMSCWGRNDSGQLGLGSVMYVEAIPTTVPGLTGMDQVMAGKDMTCAIDNAHDVYCWGRNTAGQMGAGLADPTRAVRILSTFD